MEHLSPWELCEGNLEGEGGSFSLAPGGCVKEGSEMGISLHRSPAGESGRGLVYWGL